MNVHRPARCELVVGSCVLLRNFRAMRHWSGSDGFRCNQQQNPCSESGYCPSWESTTASTSSQHCLARQTSERNESPTRFVFLPLFFSFFFVVFVFGLLALYWTSSDSSFSRLQFPVFRAGKLNAVGARSQCGRRQSAQREGRLDPISADRSTRLARPVANHAPVPCQAYLLALKLAQRPGRRQGQDENTFSDP